MYTPNDQVGMRGFNVLVRSSLAPEVLSRAIQNAVAARDADIPIEALVSMDEILGQALLSRRVTALTLTSFSTVALLLAAMGLYGVLAYYVTSARQEIGSGWRLVRGRGPSWSRAKPQRLHGGARSRDRPRGVGGGTRLMERFLYGVQPTDPMTFISVSGGLAW